jgi:predicted amidohydrolase
MRYKVALAQGPSLLGDVAGCLRRAEQEIQRAREAGARLIAFPEMFLGGYLLMDGRDHETLYRIAESVHGRSVARLIELAREYDLHIVMGMPLRSERVDGIIYDAAVLVGPEGVIGVHRKVGLPTGYYVGRWFYDGNYVKPGNRLDVFDTPLGRIGLLIGYEIMWPELARILAAKGAQHIVVISASPDNTDRFHNMVLPVRAMENTVYLSYVNLHDVEHEVLFFGGSRVISPTGSQHDDKSNRRGEDLLVATVDLNLVARVRAAYPNLRDRAAVASSLEELARDFPEPYL